MHDIKQIVISLIWQTPAQPVATKFVHLNDDDFISLLATLPFLGQTARNCDVWIGRLDKKSIWNPMKKYRYEILLSSTSNFGAISDIKAIILHTSIKILHNLHAKVCFIFYLRVCVYIYIYILFRRYCQHLYIHINFALFITVTSHERLHLHCLSNPLLRRTSKKISKLRIPGTLWWKPSMIGGFPPQWPVKRSFDVFFDQRLNKQLSEQSSRRLFETPSISLWPHHNELP